MLKARLLIIGGADGPAEIQLDHLPLTLGRSQDCGICLPHALVSRSHCEIYEEDELLAVRDLGSLNGTFVGNQRVEQSVLKPGELLTVGTVTFRALYGSLAAEDADQVIATTDTTDTAAGSETATTIRDFHAGGAETETLRPNDTLASANQSKST
jgi:pSer/pThr/pTyr-binding forkhead associated (FHA) protein